MPRRCRSDGNGLRRGRQGCDREVQGQGWCWHRAAPPPPTDKGSVTIEKLSEVKIKKGSDKDVEVTVKVVRKDYDKLLKVEAKLDSAELKGVKLKTEKTEIKGDESTAKITLSIAKDASGEGELHIMISGDGSRNTRPRPRYRWRSDLWLNMAEHGVAERGVAERGRQPHEGRPSLMG